MRDTCMKYMKHYSSNLLAVKNNLLKNNNSGNLKKKGFSLKIKQLNLHISQKYFLSFYKWVCAHKC